MVGYYRRFVEGFSRLAMPITNLLQKSNKFEWTEECENNFQVLKKQLPTVSVLITPEGNEGFVVNSDASEKDKGAF